MEAHLCQNYEKLFRFKLVLEGSSLQILLKRLYLGNKCLQKVPAHRFFVFILLKLIYEKRKEGCKL